MIKARTKQNANPSPLPKPFPEAWASEWGEDRYGLWMGLVYKEVRQLFRWIPAGRFLMGSPETEPERNAESELQHEVTLTRGFWLAESACTQILWQAVMGENRSRFQGPDRPVENVSWEDVQAFIKKMNADLPGLQLRLPTEAEWEYACRAGSTAPFWFGGNITPEQVNYDGNYPYASRKKGKYRNETVAVKSLPCNGWGLYEMHGNVWEWCQDWYTAYPLEAVVDPTGPSEGGARVLRGGSWLDFAGWSRSACRSWDLPGFRFDSTGFRLARGQSSRPGGAQKQESSSPGQSQRSGDGQGVAEPARLDRGLAVTTWPNSAGNSITSREST
ncbi:MAG: formylglycine-generating enzyme family protein [Methylococcales bacterium]